MPNITPELLNIFMMIFGVGSVYGLIRADLRNMHDKLTDLIRDISRVEKNTDKAHSRLDDHIKDYHR